MTTFVLVPGAWLGGWCWQQVEQFLRSENHHAISVTLTGVGERNHLLSPDVGLGTHVMDVVATCEYVQDEPVVLVGHSYAGSVIEGAAATIPNRIARLVFVDAVTPVRGESFVSFFDRDAGQAVENQVVEISGAGVLPPPSEIGGNWSVPASQQRWFLNRVTPHPYRTWTDRLEQDAYSYSIPRMYISCQRNATDVLESSRSEAKRSPNWTYREISTGHMAMMSMPNELTQLML